jgi:aryl-alcohol dehydrogenase-like predicted oxidoreductase
VTAKWGVRGLARVLRQETRDAPGVEVCTVAPAGVDTPIYAQAATWAGHLGQPPPPVDSPEKVANAVLRTLDQPRRERVVGVTSRLVQFGFVAAPGGLRRRRRSAVPPRGPRAGADLGHARQRLRPDRRGRSPAPRRLGSVPVETRLLGRTGRDVSVIGLGCWQLGADWGAVSEDDALAVLHAALDGGVTFLDTADVYGDGRSEQLIGRLLRERPDAAVLVATKAGRRADPHVPEAFTRTRCRAWTDRSRENLGVDTLDLVQLHCPPTPVYDDDRVFDALDDLVAQGSLAAYGVSVETVDEALRGHRPARRRERADHPQRLPPQGRSSGCSRPPSRRASASSPRVPLASGLLSGKYDESTTFGEDDHRNYNRSGAAFDVAETFSGVRTTSACGRPARSPISPPTGRRPLSSRCAGSSTSPA